MKILHVLDHSVPIQSGYSFRTLAILRRQRALGWETAHLTGVRQHESPDKGELVDDLRFLRTTYAPFQSVPMLRYAGMVGAMARRIRRAIAEEAPDVVHAHSPSLNGLAALLALRGTGIPLVYEVRAFWEDAGVDHGTAADGGTRYRAIRRLETWVLHRASAVTTICEGLRDDIVSRGVPTDRITVVPNAVDAERFEFMRPPDKGIQDRLDLHERPVIGFIGSFYAYEGLDLLIDAMPAILAERPGVRLLLVGGEEQESVLRRQVADLGLERSITFIGRVPHDEVGDWYATIDIMAYPRRSMRLTELVTPLKPLEAMAFGKLLVLSDVGGHREIAGPLFERAAFAADSVQELATKLIERIDMLGASGEERLEGRRHVERDRSWPAVVDRYRPVYERVTER